MFGNILIDKLRFSVKRDEICNPYNAQTKLNDIMSKHFRKNNYTVNFDKCYFRITFTPTLYLDNVSESEGKPILNLEMMSEEKLLKLLRDIYTALEEDAAVTWIDFTKNTLPTLPVFEHIKALSKRQFKYPYRVNDCTSQGSNTSLILSPVKRSKDIKSRNTNRQICFYTKVDEVNNKTKVPFVDNVYLSDDEIAQIKEISELTSRERLLNTINLLSNLENEIKWSSQKTIMFQTGIIKACMSVNMTSGDVQELQNRIDKLESKINNINSLENVQSSQNNYTSDKQSKVANAEIAPKRSVTTSNKINQSDFWRKVIDNLKQSKKMMLYTTLLNSRAVQIDDLNIEIEFPNGLTPFNEKVINDPNNRNDLMKAIFAITGNQMNIKLKDSKVKMPEEKEKKLPLQELGIDINIIE